MSIIEKIRGFGYSTEKTKQDTLDITRIIFRDNIKGDFVECGVAQGVQVAIMESVNNQQKEPRKVWCFDSFEGIPMATNKDDQQCGIGYFSDGVVKPVKKGDHLISSGITVHTLTQVQFMLSNWIGKLDNFIFVKGWFENTVPECEVKDIALLRLNGDLYESTIVCLEHLFPKVVEGGYVIIDDWGLAGCRLACDEYFKDYKNVLIFGDVDSNEPILFQKK